MLIKKCSDVQMWIQFYIPGKSNSVQPLLSFKQVYEEATCWAFLSLMHPSVCACSLVSTCHIEKPLYVLIELYNPYHVDIGMCCIILYQTRHSSRARFPRSCSCTRSALAAAQLRVCSAFYLLGGRWVLRQVKLIVGNLNSVLVSLILQKFCVFFLMCSWLTFKSSLYNSVVASFKALI